MGQQELKAWSKKQKRTGKWSYTQFASYLHPLMKFLSLLTCIPKKGKPVRKVGQFHALLLDIEQVAVGVQVIQPVGIDEGGWKWINMDEMDKSKWRWKKVNEIDLNG